MAVLDALDLGSLPVRIEVSLLSVSHRSTPKQLRNDVFLVN